MPQDFPRRLLALLTATALHAAVMVLAWGLTDRPTQAPTGREADAKVIVLRVLPPAEPPRPPVQPAPPPERPPVQAIASPREPRSMAAPPAPTAQEWAFAARYALKNSKGYRYTWGQQVRSQMGTAVEGPDQGTVRFRVEIAADGSLTRLDTLWTTSAVAEQRARRAIETMPPLPPTPTGQPLVFERTISFSPFGSDDGPPVYRDDCLPDPPVFRNPFVWDGRSTPTRAALQGAEAMDPQTLEDCLRQLPKDSVDAEAAHDQRLRDQWDSSRLGR